MAVSFMPSFATATQEITKTDANGNVLYHEIDGVVDIDVSRGIGVVQYSHTDAQMQAGGLQTDDTASGNHTASVSGHVHAMDSDGYCSSCGGLIVARRDDGTVFTSLEEAFSSGGNIAVLKDIIPDSDMTVTVRSGKTVCLDLNGKTLGYGSDRLLNIDNYGVFRLCDSSDDHGELHGSVFTKGFEEKHIDEYDNVIVTDYAYGAHTVIDGGRIYGDVGVMHDEGKTYYASEAKPNPSLEYCGGYMIGGHFYLADEAQGDIVICGGAFIVEPPSKFIKSGYEAEKQGDYYRLAAKQYYAGWVEPSFSESGLSEHARAVACRNSLVNSFVAGDLDLVNVTGAMSGFVFNPETDSLKCALIFTATGADERTAGGVSVVTGMKFSVSPEFRIYRNGQNTAAVIGWDMVNDWEMTVRFPVDSALTSPTVALSVNGVVKFDSVDVRSEGGEKYIQVCLSSSELAGEISYSVVIKPNCEITYDACGGSVDADGNMLTSVKSYIAGGDDLCLQKNMFMREHYSFGGWSIGGQQYPEGSLIPFVVSDLKAEACWVPDSYAIDYVLNGGENSTLNIASYDYDSTFHLSDPVRDDAVFAGWFDNAEFEGEPVTAVMPGESGEKTFYAKWLVNVTITIGGEGEGIAADSSHQIVSGESFELSLGDSFEINLFQQDGSYIESVLVNGEAAEAASHMVFENVSGNLSIVIVFSPAAPENAQIVDLSGATAEDGSALSTYLMSRAERAFENSNVADFEATGVQNAVDVDAAKRAFEEATGLTIGAFDTVSVMLRMDVMTVSSDGNMITGYKMDIKPVMTVVSSEGTVIGTEVVVPNEAIVSPVTFRIPIDEFAYMDDIVAYHEGELFGYFKIEGSTPNRYVELTADEFSTFEVLVVRGSSNHPVAAIGENGYETLDKALSAAAITGGDTVFILATPGMVPDRAAIWKGGAKTGKLADALADVADYEDIYLPKLPEEAGITSIPDRTSAKGIFVQKANGIGYSEVPVIGTDTVTVTYVPNGVTTSVPSPSYTLVSGNDYIIEANPFSDVTGVFFKHWNLNGEDKAASYNPGETSTFFSDTTLYAIWSKGVEVEYKDGSIKDFATLQDAYESIDTRERGSDKVCTIRLFRDVEEDVALSKEFFLDLNGFDIRSSDGTKSLKAGTYSVTGSDYTALKYATDRYQIRSKQYKITFAEEKSTSAVFKTNNDSVYYTDFASPVSIKIPSRVRYMSDGTARKAYFAGWYYDEAFTQPIDNTGEVSKTKVLVTGSKTLTVKAPEWPEDKVLYARWCWPISVYYNHYGYITCDGVTIPSGTVYYFYEGAKPEFKFVPYDGYHVYRRTVTAYTQTKEADRYSYIPEWYEKFKDETGTRDHGLMIQTMIVVTFARGRYNPFTGDTGSAGFFTALMTASLVTGAAAMTVLRHKRKKKNPD